MTRRHRKPPEPFSLDRFMHAMGLRLIPPWLKNQWNTEGINWQWWNGECELFGIDGDYMVVELWGYDHAAAAALVARYSGEYLSDDNVHAGVRHRFPPPSTLDEAVGRFLVIGYLSPQDDEDVRTEYAMLPFKTLVRSLHGLRT